MLLQVERALRYWKDIEVDEGPITTKLVVKRKPKKGHSRVQSGTGAKQAVIGEFNSDSYRDITTAWVGTILKKGFNNPEKMSSLYQLLAQENDSFAATSDEEKEEEGATHDLPSSGDEDE